MFWEINYTYIILPKVYAIPDGQKNTSENIRTTPVQQGFES